MLSIMADSKAAAFPPGFRFYPSESQLLSYYLPNKKANPAIPGGYNMIRELHDLPERDPFELPDTLCYSYGYKGRKRHWYCYTAAVVSEEKKTKSGYWKRKARVRDVVSREGFVLGTRTSFSFCVGDSPNTALPTDWVLYQYALVNHVEGSFVLCRVFSRSDSGFNSCAKNNGVLLPDPVSTSSIQLDEQAQAVTPAAAPPIPAFLPPSSLQQLFNGRAPYSPIVPAQKLAPGVYHVPPGPGGNVPELRAPFPGYLLQAVPPPVESFSAVPTVLTTALVNATPEQRRTMLGENLYPLVEMWEKDKTAKVTGMLLEMDNTEILHLLESPEALRARVADAMDVLHSFDKRTRHHSPPYNL